jgi:hypothetical protein
MTTREARCHGNHGHGAPAIQKQLDGKTVDWMGQESSDVPMDKQTASTW